MHITIQDITQKQSRVRAAYAQHGFPSPEYEKEFDELHDMRLLFMADKFRAERGLPPNAKTPYCPDRPALS